MQNEGLNLRLITSISISLAFTEERHSHYLAKRVGRKMLVMPAAAIHGANDLFVGLLLKQHAT